MMSIGIIACAYGQPETDDLLDVGDSNRKIADVAVKIGRITNGIIATQWEVEGYVNAFGGTVGKSTVFGPKDSPNPSPTHYVNTEQLFDESLAYFKSVGIRHVVIVAQPFHLHVIRFKLKPEKNYPNFYFDDRYDDLMKQIPYDRSGGNIQWWTRGPIRFGLYLVKVALTGKHGEPKEVKTNG